MIIGGKNMADSGITKKALASALKELMSEKPFVSISVSEICDKCDMNRKSFYYHFKDKEDLVNWIFDTEFVAVLQAEVIDEDKATLGERIDYFTKVMKLFYDNRKFYKKAFLIEGQNSFNEHFRELTYPIFAKKIELIYDDEEISDFQISFFADSIIYSIKRWITSSQPMTPEEYTRQLLTCIVKPAIHISEEVKREIEKEKAKK